MLWIDRAEFPEHVSRILKGQPTPDDRQECELLQCLIAGPQWTGLVRREVGTDDFLNPTLRDIAQACFDIDESGAESLIFTQLLAAFDTDEPAKKLAVWLDEQATIKQLKDTLGQQAEATDAITTDDCPHLLRQAIDKLKWRREEQSHKQMALELSAQCEGARSLDAEAENLLRQFSDFHQKRATKKATG